MECKVAAVAASNLFEATLDMIGYSIAIQFNHTIAIFVCRTFLTVIP